MAAHGDAILDVKGRVEQENTQREICRRSGLGLPAVNGAQAWMVV